MGILFLAKNTIGGDCAAPGEGPLFMRMAALPAAENY